MPRLCREIMATQPAPPLNLKRSKPLPPDFGQTASKGPPNMAYKLVQVFKFEKVDYSYDRTGDVLDISFGPPAPAIALQVEDWLAIQVRINPPSIQGMTIVGFKTVFEKINRYAEKELPKRMKRLAKVEMSIAYDDE